MAALLGSSGRTAPAQAGRGRQPGLQHLGRLPPSIALGDAWRRAPRRRGGCPTLAASTAVAASAEKEALLAAIAGSERGSRAGAEQRGRIEEALAAVEALDAGERPPQRTQAQARIGRSLSSAGAHAAARLP